MKKSFVFLFLILVLASTYFGLKNHLGVIGALPKELGELRTQKKLKEVHPLLEDQKIVAVVLGENHSADVERALTSVFTQTYPSHRVVYIDNGSTDGTYEKVAALREKHSLEVVRYEQKKPVLEALYPLIGKCDSHEIIALIDGKDWLFHENVFDHLNCAYANPDVWMTYSRSISHPDYQIIEGEVFSESLFLEKGFRQKSRKTLASLTTFYAGFFKQIKLQDFLYHGEFIDECFPLALQLPLVEMGPEHILFMDEISYVKNKKNERVDHQFHLQKVAAIEAHLRSLPPYSTLSHLSIELAPSKAHRYKADVVVFSEDSPLQLYACLESFFAKAGDINEVYVLYHARDPEFQRAYLNLQSEFHLVHFLNVCDCPGNDYATLLAKALENKNHASPFVVFGTDQLFYEEKLDFHEAIEAMEKAHVDHFFMAFEEREPKAIPAVIPINKGIYACQLGEKEVNPPWTLALCRKSLFEQLEGISDFHSFKKAWKKKLSPTSVALFYEEKKTFPLTIDKDVSLSQKKAWGIKFIEGFKIDLSSLTCELKEDKEGEYPLIKREKRPLIQR